MRPILDWDKFLARGQHGRAFPPCFPRSPRLQAGGPKHRSLEVRIRRTWQAVTDHRVSIWILPCHFTLTITLPLASNSRVAILTRPDGKR
jgi:hypothetical protein